MTSITKNRIAGGMGGVLSALTIIEGSAVLWGSHQPSYVVLPWLLVYNVAMGFVGFGVAVTLWMHRSWATKLAVSVVVAHATVLVTLVILLAIESPVATQSVQAMTMRTTVWLVIALVAWKSGNAMPRKISPALQDGSSNPE